MAGFNPVGEELEDIAFIDGRCREDARSRCVARNFADGEPLAAGERRRCIKTESAASDRLPTLTRGIAATGHAIRKGEGEGLCEILSPPWKGGVGGGCAKRSMRLG